jgi:hypothetical protein
VSDTAEKLLEVSEHARHPSNGKDYALRTARTAAGYVERRRQQKAIKHARGCDANSGQLIHEIPSKIANNNNVMS